MSKPAPTEISRSAPKFFKNTKKTQKIKNKKFKTAQKISRENSPDRYTVNTPSKMSGPAPTAFLQNHFLRFRKITKKRSFFCFFQKRSDHR